MISAPVPPLGHVSMTASPESPVAGAGGTARRHVPAVGTGFAGRLRDGYGGLRGGVERDAVAVGGPVPYRAGVTSPWQRHGASLGNGTVPSRGNGSDWAAAAVTVKASTAMTCFMAAWITPLAATRPVS